MGHEHGHETMNGDVVRSGSFVSPHNVNLLSCLFGQKSFESNGCTGIKITVNYCFVLSTSASVSGTLSEELVETEINGLGGRLVMCSTVNWKPDLIWHVSAQRKVKIKG